MRKIIISTFALAFAVSLFGQQTSSPKLALTPSDYLNKSKRQKNTALYVLGGGAALIIVGAVIPEGERTGDINWISWSEEHKNDGIKGAFISIGVLSMLGSVPFFIASGKNKRRANAVSASFKTENASIARGYNLSRINYPAISFKIVLY